MVVARARVGQRQPRHPDQRERGRRVGGRGGGQGGGPSHQAGDHPGQGGTDHGGDDVADAVDGVGPVPEVARHQHREERPGPGAAERVGERAEHGDADQQPRAEDAGGTEDDDQGHRQGGDRVVEHDQLDPTAAIEDRPRQGAHDDPGKGAGEDGDPGDRRGVEALQREEDERHRPHLPGDAPEQGRAHQAWQPADVEEAAVGEWTRGVCAHGFGKRHEGRRWAGRPPVDADGLGKGAVQILVSARIPPGAPPLLSFPVMTDGFVTKYSSRNAVDPCDHDTSHRRGSAPTAAGAANDRSVPRASRARSAGVRPAGPTRPRPSRPPGLGRRGVRGAGPGRRTPRR